MKLLEQNTTIHMRDGLGTYIHKINIRYDPIEYGWKIKGREDVTKLLRQSLFDNLSSALSAAKSLCHKFQENKTHAKSQTLF